MPRVFFGAAHLNEDYSLASAPMALASDLLRTLATTDGGSDSQTWTAVIAAGAAILAAVLTAWLTGRSASKRQREQLDEANKRQREQLDEEFLRLTTELEHDLVVRDREAIRSALDDATQALTSAIDRHNYAGVEWKNRGEFDPRSKATGPLEELDRAIHALALERDRLYVRLGPSHAVAESYRKACSAVIAAFGQYCRPIPADMEERQTDLDRITDEVIAARDAFVRDATTLAGVKLD